MADAMGVAASITCLSKAAAGYASSAAAPIAGGSTPVPDDLLTSNSACKTLTG